MTMRSHLIMTDFGAESAYRLVELLDQLRDVIIEMYGNEVMAMLQDDAPVPGIEQDQQALPF